MSALGYEKERRDLAKGLGIDPYTTNEVLAKKLDDWPGSPSPAGWASRRSRQSSCYSMAMSAVTITNTAVYDTPAGDLINQVQAAFVATGAPDAAIAALMKNPQYSLSVLTALARGCQRLSRLKGVASVVAFASIAHTQDETRLVAAAVNMLARHHESVQTLAQLAAPGPIIACTISGAVVVLALVDYVAWTAAREASLLAKT